MMGGGIPRATRCWSPVLPARARPCSPISSSSRASSTARTGIVAVFEKRPNDYLQTTPRGEEFEQAGPAEEAGGPLPAPAGPLDRRDLAGAPRRREADRRQAGGDRFAVRPRAGAGADVPRGLPRVALPHGGRADRPRRHGDGDGRAGRLLRRSALQPAGHRASSTDAIIMQRYVEIDGELRRAMAVVKVRASQHSKDLREYEITADGGIVVGKALKGYRGLLTGAPSMAGKRRKDSAMTGVGLPVLRGGRRAGRRARARRPDRLLEPPLFRPDRLLPRRGSRPQALGLRPGAGGGRAGQGGLRDAADVRPAEAMRTTGSPRPVSDAGSPGRTPSTTHPEDASSTSSRRESTERRKRAELALSASEAMLGARAIETTDSTTTPVTPPTTFARRTSTWSTRRSGRRS